MTTNKRIQKQLLIMCIIVIGMFGFCYALVPLYSVFCKVAGLNGKTVQEAAKIIGKPDKNRIVTVELLTTLNDSLPTQNGEFRAEKHKVELHPGEMITTHYWVKNLMNKPMVVQAIPSVSPGIAASHIQKVECFCFQHQPLNALESKEFSLVFTVDPELPAHIHTVTLAYTLFNVTP